MLLPFQKKLVDRVKAGVEEVLAGGNSYGILLLGESGAGKTYGLDQISILYPPGMDGDQPITFLVRISAETAANYRSFLESLLLQLGWSEARLKMLKSGRDCARELYKVLRTRKVVILILEEVHNSLTTESKQFRSQVEEFLKNLWNFYPAEAGAMWAHHRPGAVDRKLVIICSGTLKLKPVFEQNSELRSRYPWVIDADKLTLVEVADLVRFRQIIDAMARRFELADVIDPDDDHFCLACYLAADAHLRDLETLFQDARRLRKQSADAGPCPDRATAAALVCGWFGIAYDDFAVDLAKSFNPFRASIDEVKKAAGRLREKQKLAALAKRRR